MSSELNDALNTYLNNYLTALYTKKTTTLLNNILYNLNLQIDNICKKINISRNDIPAIKETLQNLPSSNN